MNLIGDCVRRGEYRWRIWCKDVHTAKEVKIGATCEAGTCDNDLAVWVALYLKHLIFVRAERVKGGEPEPSNKGELPERYTLFGLNPYLKTKERLGIPWQELGSAATQLQASRLQCISSIRKQCGSGPAKSLMSPAHMATQIAGPGPRRSLLPRSIAGQE